MAEYRNRYRRYVLEHFGTFDHVLVTDTDLAGGWSFDGLANTFGQDDWDFVGSYGLERGHSALGVDWLHFDAWAFRALGHPEPHSNVEVNAIVFDRGEPMLPVLSCFGGMGVYRMNAIESAEYGGPDLEHATLHARMRKGGYSPPVPQPEPDRPLLSRVIPHGPDLHPSETPGGCRQSLCLPARYRSGQPALFRRFPCSIPAARTRPQRARAERRRALSTSAGLAR